MPIAMSLSRAEAVVIVRVGHHGFLGSHGCGRCLVLLMLPLDCLDDAFALDADNFLANGLDQFVLLPHLVDFKVGAIATILVALETSLLGELATFRHLSLRLLGIEFDGSSRIGRINIIIVFFFVFVLAAIFQKAFKLIVLLLLLADVKLLSLVEMATGR